MRPMYSPGQTGSRQLQKLQQPATGSQKQPTSQNQSGLQKHLALTAFAAEAPETERQSKMLL